MKIEREREKERERKRREVCEKAFACMRK